MKQDFNWQETIEDVLKMAELGACNGNYRLLDSFVDEDAVKNAAYNQIDVLKLYEFYHQNFIGHWNDYKDKNVDQSLLPGGEGYQNFLKENLIYKEVKSYFLDNQDQLDEEMRQLAVKFDQGKVKNGKETQPLFINPSFAEAVTKCFSSELNLEQSLNYFYAESIKQEIWSEENLNKKVSERQTDYMVEMMNLAIEESEGDISIDYGKINQVEIDELEKKARKRSEVGLDLDLGIYSYLVSFIANSNPEVPDVVKLSDDLSQFRSNSIQKFGSSQ